MFTGQIIKVQISGEILDGGLWMIRCRLVQAERKSLGHWAESVAHHVLKMKTESSVYFSESCGLTHRVKKRCPEQ